MSLPESTIDGIMAFLFVAGLLLFFGGTGLVKIEKVIISGSKFTWIAGIIFALVSLLFFVFRADLLHFSNLNQVNSTKPFNLIKAIRFESQDDLSMMSLNVCNISDSTSWEQNCYEAKEKLSQAEGGYDSLYSLGGQIELLPNKKQVYSFRLRLSPPLTTAFILAKVYIPENQSIDSMFLVSTKNGVDWQSEWFYPSVSGWYQAWLDVGKGQGSPITEFHIDLYLPQSSQQAKTMEIKIDDIEFLYAIPVNN